MPMNARIINKTGMTRDTEVWVDGTRLTGVTGITIMPIGNDNVITAQVTVLIKEIDIKTEEAEIKEQGR